MYTVSYNGLQPIAEVDDFESALRCVDPYIADDFVYTIEDNDGVAAIVFQRKVYTPTRDFHPLN